jgi:hypothetical protein
LIIPGGFGSFLDPAIAEAWLYHAFFFDRLLGLQSYLSLYLGSSAKFHHYFCLLNLFKSCHILGFVIAGFSLLGGGRSFEDCGEWYRTFIFDVGGEQPPFA